MSGVEELRARLAKLSTEIDRHKEVVRKLERDKRLVQQQLNAVLDPVARLPLEISSEIFLQCLPALPALPEPRAEGVPMVLLNICNAWTAIALSIPTLWAAIHIAHPRAEGIKKILPTWIHRAGNRFLSLSLGAKFDEGVAAIIWRHGQQLKHLELSYDKEHHDDEDSDEDSDGDSGEDGINLFRESTGPLPLLETLTIHGSNIGHTHSGFQILELLRAAPNLVECIFDSVYPTYFEDMDEILILPTLRRLRFGKRDENIINDTELISRLSLPRLELLSFSFHHTYVDGFISFLERSTPPLRELVALIGFGVDFTRLTESLHLVSTLMRLEVLWPGPYLVTQLFAALADSPSLLPNLIGLTLHLRGFDTVNLFASGVADSSWKTLLRALSARRTQLRVVHVKVTHPFLPSSLQPAADILAAFRDLAADGMEVYIGTEEHNFVSG